MLVAKIVSVSHRKKDTGTGIRDKSRWLVASWPLRWQRLMPRQTGKTRRTWDKLLQGNLQVQVQGNHPPYPEKEGWSQLGPVVLSCSWLGGGHACSPQVCPIWVGLLGVLL